MLVGPVGGEGFIYTTWAAWGDLTIDFPAHEM